LQLTNSLFGSLFNNYIIQPITVTVQSPTDSTLVFNTPDLIITGQLLNATSYLEPFSVTKFFIDISFNSNLYYEVSSIQGINTFILSGNVFTEKESNPFYPVLVKSQMVNGSGRILI